MSEAKTTGKEIQKNSLNGEVTFEQLLTVASEVKKPTPMGVQVFEASTGAEFTGMYLGMVNIHVNEASPEEQEIAKDGRVKNIPNVVFAVGEYLSYRSPNRGLVQHFETVPVPVGSIVRVKCITKGSKGVSGSTWSVEVLMFPKDIPQEFHPMLETFSGFLQ